MHWRRKWQPTPAFLPGESQGQGSLVGCRLWGCRVGHDWSDLAAAGTSPRPCDSVVNDPREQGGGGQQPRVGSTRLLCSLWEGPHEGVGTRRRGSLGTVLEAAARWPDVLRSVACSWRWGHNGSRWRLWALPVLRGAESWPSSPSPRGRMPVLLPVSQMRELRPGRASSCSGSSFLRGRVGFRTLAFWLQNLDLNRNTRT